MTLDGSTLVFADDAAGLAATPHDPSCQITSAAITTVENNTDVPATMCEAASQTALRSGATLDVAFRQDWADSTGFGWFAAEHDAQQQAFQFLLGAGSDATAGPGYTGTCTLRRPTFGGDAGSVLVATMSFPVIGDLVPIKPVLGTAEAGEVLYQPA